MEKTGMVFDIVRASVHDGPGIRTVVYLKGCPLHCVWCHNPEGVSGRQEILFARNKCIGCGRCRQVCPGHHTQQDYLREGCTVCGRCVEACPVEALSFCGKKMTAEEVMIEIIKDRAYYEGTGGGVTFSGGECFQQPEFLGELAARCRRTGIHTVAETSLCFDRTRLSIAVEWIDEVFADLKHMDAAQHRKYTGGDNTIILRNLEELSRRHRNLTVRIPLIPGVNDSKENLEASAGFLNGCGSGIKAVELLKYNELARDKYILLGRDRDVFTAQAQSEGEMEAKKIIIRRKLKGEILLK